MVTKLHRAQEPLSTYTHQLGNSTADDNVLFGFQRLCSVASPTTLPELANTNYNRTAYVHTCPGRDNKDCISGEGDTCICCHHN